jgi:hypothetical protein
MRGVSPVMGIRGTYKGSARRSHEADVAFKTEIPTAAKLGAMLQVAMTCIPGATHYCMSGNKPVNYIA